MASNYKYTLPILFLTFSTLISFSMSALVKEQPLILKYHNGPLLNGPITVNLIWYGHFTPIQRSIILDFLQSLNPPSSKTPLKPSVSTWWKTIENYKVPSPPTLKIGKQILLPNYPLSKTLKNPHLAFLASKSNHSGSSINIVLTSKDVVVEGFCMNRCGTHGSSPARGGSKFAYAWVGNSETQCPGYCAWPFHQPIYGPQTEPLTAPNGDVGVDGMIINLAAVLAGTVTNPYSNGYYQGEKGAGLEAVTACTGVFGTGAYPGYAGRVLKDGVTGGSYNAVGNGRKFLLPAMWDPITSKCSTLV